MENIGHRAVAAFTLVELVVALSVAATLLAFAVPSLARYIAEQRLLDDARRLSDAIMLARSEAVKRNRHVIICAVTAVAPCGEADHWHDGWVLFEDVDGNADHDATDAHGRPRGSRRATGVTIDRQPAGPALPSIRLQRPGPPGQRGAADGHDRGLPVGAAGLSRGAREYRPDPPRPHAGTLSVKQPDDRSSRLARRVLRGAAACSRPRAFDRVFVVRPRAVP